MDPLPCLKEPLWEGRAHVVCRPMWAGAASPHMPWLAFGFDRPHNFEFINADRLPSLNCTAPALEARALVNLAARAATWQPMTAPIPNGPPLHTLVCYDDFLAAERILDGPFMQEAERRFGGGALVGIPRRGLLMATAAAGDPARVVAFATLVAGQFSGGESAPISPLVFELKDGAIVGILDGVANLYAKKAAGDADEEEKEEDGDSPRHRGTVPVTLAAAARPMFYWWTSLPSWVRLGVGLLIGLVILNRIITELMISLLP